MNLSSFGRVRPLLMFILVAAMVTGISLTIYASVQQSYRQGANDPQIEATEAVGDLLDQGAPPDGILGQSSGVDMSKSLSLFIIIFDKDGKVTASSGKLGDTTPAPPSGIFDYLKSHDQERFTWEPQKGVRIAAVIKKVSGDKGYVLAGRSLREVEMRVQSLTVMVGIAWIALLVLSGLMALLAVIPKNLEIVEEVNIIGLQSEAEKATTKD